MMVDRSGQQIGNYRLVRRLGRGAFAEVYLGEHRYLKNYAALKVLRTTLKDEDTARFLSEAQTLVRLIHPNIVRVLEYVIERGTPVLIMDYAPGGTVRDHYPRGSRLSLAMTANYVKQVAAALQYAHDHNVIHRDVKPENILLSAGQHILLSDFGIAVLAPSPELLSTQDMAGTVPYVAPEQVQGRPTFASDQYSLGIVTYEWLCGRRPFEGNEWEILRRHVHDAPPPLREISPELPAEVENVVLRALAKDPQQRFVAVQAFARALERATQASAPDDSDDEVTAPLRERSPSPFATVADRTSRSIFLSASPADDAFAARLEADLEARGIPVEHRPHMLNQEDAVRQAIRAAHVTLVVISPHTRSSRTVQEHLQIAGIYERQLVFVWAAGEDLATLLPEGWGKSAVIDLIDAREEDHYELALEEIVVRLQQESTATEPVMPFPSETFGEPRNPYKGLRPFTQEDSADFFGRDGLIQELAQTLQQRLALAQPGTREARLLTVIGPSGSGKSSVVMAGLLPQLARGLLPGSEQWEYLEPMVPEDHPIETLVRTLAPRLSDRSLKTIREDLEDDSGRGLHLLADQVVKRPSSKVVLVVDQFEEVFASTVPEEERQHFFDLLVTAVTEPRGPVIVILTLRADFYDRPLSYRALGRLIEQHHNVVLPMEIEDLRAIIEQPAALPDVQLTFEGNLVGDLLFEAQGQVGALPLLEFALDQLFERRDGHWLTLQAYQEMGRVRGALAKQAESTYGSLPSKEHRRLVRALFLRLIDPGMSEQDTTRRRANLEELSLPDPEQTTIMREAADAFVRARLLTVNVIEGSLPGEKATRTIEVSHEALIREWTRLSEWLHESREDIPRQQTISADAAEWERRGRTEEWVYHGPQLAEAQAWAERNVPSNEEVVFLKASVAEQQRQEAVERRRQELERKLQRQTVNRLRGLVAVISLFLVASIVFASVIGINLQQNMQLLQQVMTERDIALSRALAANANIFLTQHELDRALLLSVKANQIVSTYEARDSLLSALEYSPHIVKILSGESKDINALAFGSDGRTLLSSDAYGVYRWDTKAREKLPDPLTTDSNVLGNAAFSSDGRMLVTSNSNGVWLWNTEANLRLTSLPLPTNILPNTPNTPLTFSPDGTLVGAGRCSQYSSDGSTCLATQIFVWKVLSKERVGLFTVPTTVNGLAFSPGDTKLASASPAGIQFWSISTGQPSGTSLIDKAGVNSFAFSPDGKKLATGDADNTIRLWNLATGQVDSSFTGHMDQVTSVAFSPDGTKLASGSMDNNVSLWNVATAHRIGKPLVGHTDAITQVAFNSDGTMLASGSAGGTIILWNVDSDSTISQQIGNVEGLESPLFSPDGTTLLTGNEQGNILLQDAMTGKLLNTLKTTTLPLLTPNNPQDISLSPIGSIALSRDGTTLAAGRLDGTITLWNLNWNLKTGHLVTHFLYPHILRKIMLSSDGKILAAAGDGGSVTLWDVTKGTSTPIHSFHATDYQFGSLPIPVALSPDGKFLAAGSCKVLVSNQCKSGQVLLWNVETGLPSDPPLLGQQSSAFDAAFSPDGHTLASSNQDGISLWDVTTRKPEGHTLSILADSPGSPYYYTNLLFNSDGTMLASYSSTGTTFSFVLWNVQAEEAFTHVIYEDNYSQENIAFRPNQQQLASVAADSSGKAILSLWDIGIPSWYAHACTIANRDLTKAEWAQFVQNGTPGRVCPA